MGSVTASEPATLEQRSVKVKLICSHCDRVIIRHSRKGYTVRCPDCGTVNAGPALIAEQRKEKADGARRRTTRRALAAERRSERGAASPDQDLAQQAAAPAPVRRRPRRTEGAAAPAKEPQREAAPAAAPTVPARRRFLDRLMYGEEE